MGADSLIKALNFLIFGEEKKRLKIFKNKKGKVYVYYDVHGQTVAEAKRNIRNLVNIARRPMILTVVHGYRNGHAIKDMIAEQNFGGKAVAVACKGNKGETIIRVTP